MRALNKKNLVVILMIFVLGLIFFTVAFLFRNKYSTKQKTNKSVVVNDCFKDCELISILSSKFSHEQKAFWYKSKRSGQPLIVSLHTWGGTYLQEDSIAYIAKELDWNYIHPDYGGAQWLKNSCCYEPSVQDIDDAIGFAIKENLIDTNKIVVIGKSGGGTGVLASYLKSKYASAYFMAWSPITDYVSWYNEVKEDADLEKRYLAHILEGTNSNGSLNIEQARLKSPYHYNFEQASYPLNKKLIIYAGIKDGLDGWSTSITQPIFFYNKLLDKFNIEDSVYYITNEELSYLMKYRTAIDTSIRLKVGRRNLFHYKKFGNISYKLFDGGHEILYDQVKADFNSIINE